MRGDPLTVGSLFTGIGGLDLGLERAGMRVRWQCEIEAYCQRVLAARWPGVPCYPDVRTIDESVERVDVICGGFPCQPASQAGKRLGTADDRWLWPEFARVIRLLRPRYVLVENVPGLVTVNAGRAFGEVLGSLATLGYDAEWRVLSAADVGAPHLRKRLWLVAYATGERGRALWQSGTAEAGTDARPVRAGAGGGARALADADDAGRSEQRRARSASQEYATLERGGALADAEGEPERTGLCAGGQAGERRRRPSDSGGAEHSWTVEPDVGRVADGVPKRVDRLRALGNAVVPQCAEVVGRLIAEHAAAVR